MKYLIALALIITPMLMIYSQKTQANEAATGAAACAQNGVECSCNSKAPQKASSAEPKKGCGCGSKSCSQ